MLFHRLFVIKIRIQRIFLSASSTTATKNIFLNIFATFKLQQKDEWVHLMTKEEEKNQADQSLYLVVVLKSSRLLYNILQNDSN